MALAGAGGVWACVGENAAETPRSSPPPPPVDEDGGTTLSPDAAPPALCPLGCLPPAPEGWTGPSAVYDGPEPAQPLACPPLYPQREIEAYQNVEGAPATCTCTGTPSGSTCEVTGQLWYFPERECTGSSVPVNYKVPGFACPARTSQSGSTKITGRTFVPGTCTYEPPAPTRPKPTFEKTNVACGLAQVASCAERPDCAAAPSPSEGFTRLCIHKEGDELCPSHDYAARFVAYRTVQDERGCTPCEGAPTGQCGNTFALSVSPMCSPGLDVDAGAFNTCISYGAITNLNLNGLGPINVKCPTTGSGPTGGVSLADPVTFCCNK